MSTFLDIQNQVLQTLQGFGLEQPRVAFLSTTISGSAPVFLVDDATNVEAGVAEIGSEAIYIQSVNRTTNSITTSPDGRGFYGTTPATHEAGSRLTVNPVWPRHQVKQAINSTLASMYPTVFGVGSTSFTYVPSTTTYSMPADAESVLQVVTDVNGPSLEQAMLRAWAFNSSAPVADWATGNSITLYEPAVPGRTVSVTYTKQLGSLTNDTDTLESTGLRESGLQALVFGTCSTLAAMVDMARLPGSAAEAKEMADANPVGSASRVSAQLYQRYLLELEAERRRLRTAYPVVVRMRKR